MRQSIGGSWIFMLVIIFTMIFAGYIALTINYSKSYRVKNEVLSIIEKSQGFTQEGINLINNYLTQSGYKNAGACKIVSGSKVFGVEKLESNVIPEQAVPGKKYSYCFSKYTGYHSYYKTRAYYRVTLFFKFDLPIFHELSTFDVEGQTSEIDATYDYQFN